MLEVDISVAYLTIILFGTLIIALLSGLPLAFALGGISVLFALLFWSPESLSMFATKALGAARSIVMVAIPLFIFMGVTLSRSGIADELYGMAYHWIGQVRGGLAMGTVAICAVFAAMAGASAPATVTMAIVALPSMRKRGYKPGVALGSIMAGGALGILIPPSVTMIVFSLQTGVSVGHLFIGGIMPGLLLTALFMAYIWIRCLIQPDQGPAIPAEERGTWRERVVLLRAVILPIILVIAVLGSIYTGIATPTEASAVGAFGALIAAAIHRRLNWHTMWDILKESIRITTMVMWICIGGLWLAAVYQAIGATHFVTEIIEGLPVGPWGIIILMQVTFLILGMLMDPLGIIFIAMPIYVPIILELGFNPVWFGVLFIVNMEMAYLTPPFGVNLFYMRAIVPKEEVSMLGIYSAAIPFIFIQLIGLILVMIFPQIILWLPSMMM